MFVPDRSDSAVMNLYTKYELQNTVPIQFCITYPFENYLYFNFELQQN